MSRQAEMEQEWSSWEPLIRDDLERLEHRLQSCYGAMSTFSINRASREAYVLPRLVQLIQEIAVY